ncbi:hypothetical protein [Thioalkalivibrio sp. AKL17]|uniref:hypothetical protein n=1 Tax=Thioalkalivibrio sp. AKL17 TaxID=1158160 RepID=UPI000366D985|nr:hypothetical protein [Thioalkalivibrio sp. AKL17]
MSGLSRSEATLKRGFDLLGAAAGLLLTFWLIALAWVLAPECADVSECVVWVPPTT